MSPQRRTALISVLAACALIGLKLGTAIATHSLGLLSEAVHSGTDLVAALLTFVALGVAGRPADPGHAYGHAKAEHLAALGEAAILVAASLVIAWRALWRLTGLAHGQVDPRWYALVVLGVVLVVDASRALVSQRAARRLGSPALQANAVHFASDFVGTTAVLLGLAAARAGYHWADSAAAMFVAVLVLFAAAPLMRINIDVLMDRVPAKAEEAASEVERAIAESVPDVHAVRTHLEPIAETAEGREDDASAERAVVERIVREATGSPPRELRFLHTDSGLVAQLTLAIDPSASLGEAHARATEIEERIRGEQPGIADVIVHTEP